MALPPRFARQGDDPTPSPRPTPPSSTTSIPLCFPSPTSVAHVLNQSPTTSSSHPTQQSAPIQKIPPPTAATPPTTTSAQHAHMHTTQTSTLRYYYHTPHLSPTHPTPPRPPVTKAQFVDHLNSFLNSSPPNHQADPSLLVPRIRNLLDHLDALVEQLSLRVTNSLFDALSHPNCLNVLILLLADISARSTPIVTDLRKSYRYPYLIANILANGTIGIRDAFLAQTNLVTHLLSFLDGNVVLITTPAQQQHRQQNQVFAHQNPIIVGNVVQILVSYMETSPEPLLTLFRNRPTLIPSLVNLLHIGSVPQLLTSLIPDRCVDDLTSMDPRNVSFDTPIKLALAVLADGAALHHLVNAFVSATQTIFSSVLDESDAQQHDSQSLQDAEQLAFNVVHVYATLINKCIRAIRLQPASGSCQYLNVFGNPDSANTISLSIRAGIDLFRETAGEQASILNHALQLTVDLLKYVQQDSDRRVASLSGQPEPLNTSALEVALDPLFKPLIGVLIDTAGTGPKHGQVRLRILELFVKCQAVCSERLSDSFDKMRFGEVAMKIMLMNPRNSLMQHLVCRGVESALITNYRTGAYVHHWLVKSKLINKIMNTWRRDNGDEVWAEPGRAQEASYLSALLHMACCVEHWMAIQREGASVEQSDPVRELLGEEVVTEFERFCKTSVDRILEIENRHLGGPRPRRRGSRAPGAGFGRSFGSFGTTSAAVLKRSLSGNGASGNGGNRAHLVRSPSAHRFGYVAPGNSGRSRLDDMFIEDDLSEGGGFGTTDIATSFASIFNVESEKASL